MNVNYQCQNCGSTEILKDAYATWDAAAQEWVLHSTYDELTCNVCRSRSDIIEVEFI
jgi:hypothetical protein